MRLLPVGLINRYIAIFLYGLLHFSRLFIDTMGVSKNIFSEKKTALALLLKTLGHGARVSIIQYILDHGSATNKGLVDSIQYLSQSCISEHIAQLKNINLIIANQRDTSMIYTINQQLWNEIKDLARGFVDGNFSLSEQD